MAPDVESEMHLGGTLQVAAQTRAPRGILTRVLGFSVLKIPFIRSSRISWSQGNNLPPGQLASQLDKPILAHVPQGRGAEG